MTSSQDLAEALNANAFLCCSREPERARIAARSAVNLSPDDGYYIDSLACAELCNGMLEDAVARFRKAIVKGCPESEVGLALALITRATPENIAEACGLLEAWADKPPVDPYTAEALAALKALPAPIDAELAQRIASVLALYDG